MDRSAGIIIIVVTLAALYLYYTGKLKLSGVTTGATGASATGASAGTGSTTGASPGGTIGTPGINPNPAYGAAIPGTQPGLPPLSLASTLDPLNLAALLSPASPSAAGGTTVNVYTGTGATQTAGGGTPGIGLLPGASYGPVGVPASLPPGVTAGGGFNIPQAAGLAAAGGLAGAETQATSSLLKCHGVLDCGLKSVVAGGLAFGLFSLL